MTAPTRERGRILEGLKKLYRGQNDWEIIGRTRMWLTISAIALLICLISLLFRGLNFGIEFEGGSVWTARVATSVSESDVRDVASRGGADSPNVQFIVDDNGHRKARVTSISTDKDVVQKVKDQLATLPEAGEEQVVADSVSASFGSQISRKAFQALLIFLVLFAVAASLRFEWKMAVAALVALIHDLLITAGVYSIVGFEVVPATVIATLTILGYSLYDTIVVFDKIQENTALAAQAARQSYSETANDSLNHVMMRSINTSLFSLLPVGSLLVVGLISIAGGTLKDFALALFVGLLSGAYSSIFVATPVLALLKEREPRYQAIRARVETRAVRSRPGRIEGRPVVVVEEEDIEAAVEAAAAVADDEAVAAAPRPAAKKGAPAAKKGTQARRPAAKGRPSGSRKKKRR